MSNSYRDLKVWQRSIDLAEQIYRLTDSFPASEGWGRRSRKDYARFVLVSRGSNDELQTQLVIAERLGFCKAEQFVEATALSDEIGRMLSGLHKFLQTPHRKPLEPRT
jgi:hypothetical protein